MLVTHVFFFVFSRHMYKVDETTTPPSIIYVTELTTPVKDYPPLQHPDRSRYGNKPDIDLLDPEDRAKALNALRQRRHKEKKEQEMSRLVTVTKVILIVG